MKKGDWFSYTGLTPERWAVFEYLTKDLCLCVARGDQTLFRVGDEVFYEKPRPSDKGVEYIISDEEKAYIILTGERP